MGKNKKGDVVRWLIPKTNPDQKAPDFRASETSGIFNVPLAENDGGVVILEASCKLFTSSGHHEADDDIRSGRIKRFDNPDDMIESLKQPWQD